MRTRHHILIIYILISLLFIDGSVISVQLSLHGTQHILEDIGDAISSLRNVIIEIDSIESHTPSNKEFYEKCWIRDDDYRYGEEVSIYNVSIDSEGEACFDWDDYNPPEGAEILCIIFENENGYEYGFVDTWSNEECISHKNVFKGTMTIFSNKNNVGPDDAFDFIVGDFKYSFRGNDEGSWDRIYRFNLDEGKYYPCPECEGWQCVNDVSLEIMVQRFGFRMRELFKGCTLEGCR